jgi:hypothetical protein
VKLSFSNTNGRAGRRQRGWALLVVVTLAGAALMVLAGVMNWANSNANIAARNNEYFATTYAAEAATEKVLASLSLQYQNYGFSVVSQNMSAYQSTYPTAADGSYWTNYRFSGGTTPNATIVTNTATSQRIVMSAPYTGLILTANIYEIIANAQNASSQFGIVSTVGQQLYLGCIPLFQFAIFYQGDMEVAPGAAMTIAGTVHGNANIYLDPQSTLTFTGNVSAVGSNFLNESPNDPTSRPFGSVIFDGYDLNNVDPLNLPVGTNTAGTATNMSANVYAILLPPTSGQTPTSATGTNLLYNHADMIIMVSNSSITVTSGADVNGQATVITNWQSFLSTNGSFTDQRDSLTVNPVVLNVSNLVNWSATNTVLRPVLASLRGSVGADINSIYVDDTRSNTTPIITTNYGTVTTTSYPGSGTYSPPVTTNTTTTTTSGHPGSGSYIGSITTNTVSTNSTTHPNSGTYVGTITTNKNPTSYTYNVITGYTYTTISSYTYTSLTNATYTTNYTVTSQPGIVLSNGAVLPPQGLAVATPDPAYIVGNWNIKTNNTGSSDAGLTSTAYTEPSAIYADAVTILSGNWNPANSALALSSRTATSDTVNAAILTGNVPSNGSYYSGGVENFPRFLENWGGQTFTYNGSMVAMFASQIANAPWPGTTTVYSPPTRTWGFDTNFNNPNRQPPMMPQVSQVQRSGWQQLKPYSTSF